MRSMGHPNYVYRPLSEEGRAKLREAHRKRLGNRKGYYCVYGVQVPEQFKERIRSYAAIVSSFRDYQTAAEFVKDAQKANWEVPRPNYSAWDERDWQLYRELIGEGMSRSDVAKYAGVVEWYLNKGLTKYRVENGNV